MTNEEIIANLRQIVQNGTCSHVDLANMEKVLRLHNCSYLLGLITPSCQVKLNELALTIETKERYSQAVPLFHALRDYPYAVIKGAVLSKQAYGSPFCRKSADLDVLIRRQDIDYAREVLLDNGFVQGRVIDGKIIPFTRKELVFQASQSHQTAPFVKETENKFCPFINFDLNTSVFWGEYGHECDMNFVLSQTTETELFGIPFKKLSSEMEFLSLCLHHYKDMNSIYLLTMKSLKLELFCDIFYYLKNVVLDADKLYMLSKKLNVNPYIFYCLWYTNKVFNVELLDIFLTMFESAEGKSLLDTFGLCESERNEWTIDFWDRLFSPTFRDDFMATLGEKEREKIKINQMLM